MRKNIALGVLSFVVLGALTLFYILNVLTGDDPTKPELSDTTLESTDVSSLTPENQFTGTWVVNSVQSEAGYRVLEELRGVPDIEAAARTNQVRGSLILSEESLSQVEIFVDVASIESGESLRDKAFKEAVHADEFPEATFVLTNPVPIAPGTQRINTKINGMLTLNNVTELVQVAVEAQINNDKNVEIAGSAQLEFEKFNIENPSNAIAKVADVGLLEFKIVFVRE